MFDFSVNAVLVSLNTILAILIIFYYYLPLRISFKWIPLHVMVCIIGGYLLTMMSRNTPELYAMGIGWIAEMTFVLVMLSYCEGGICRNFIRYVLAGTFAQISVSLVLLICHSPLQEVGIQLDYSKFQSSDIILYNLLCLFFVFFFKPIICKLTPDRAGRKGIYFLITAAILVESLIEIIMRSRPRGFEERIVFRSLFFVLTGVILILVIVIAYRRARQLEGRQIENQQKVLSEAYKDLWKENQNLHDAKHELTRHMRRIRSLESKILEQEWIPYVNMLKEEMGSVLSIPCTGNIYVDAFMLQQYKKAESLGLLLELVLEPLPETFLEEKYLMTVLTEMFDYILKKRQRAEYIRLSVRTRGSRFLVSMEIGIQEKEYYRQKLIDQIGDKMVLRQAFRQTRYMTVNEDGGMLYRLETKRMHILVML